MKLNGFHHLTAVTADAPRNHHFYTQVLGLRMVKKTVNQDDVSAYHLFYADGVGSPGTDITFFEWPVGTARRGTREVCRTGFRVEEGSMGWWADHLKAHDVMASPPVEQAGREVLEFEDFEGQRLSLVAERGAPQHVYAQSPVPAAHQIKGLGPITMSVPAIARSAKRLTDLLGMELIQDAAGRAVFQMAGEGALYELHLLEQPELDPAQQGAGSVHHVAFNIQAADFQAWAERLQVEHVHNSGPVDRFWFNSLYFREPSGILFELATDEPGFARDEPVEKLGTHLSLPPFLETRRAEIEAGLKPLG